MFLWFTRLRTWFLAEGSDKEKIDEVLDSAVALASMETLLNNKTQTYKIDDGCARFFS